MEEPFWDVGKIKPQSPGWRQGEGYCTYAGAYQWASGCRRRRRRFTRHWISTTTRLTKSWTAEYEAFRRRDLADRHYVSLWADGIHFTIRLEDERLCAFALIGVRPDGSKEIVALGAPGSQALQHACARPGDRRWCPRLLGRGTRSVAKDGRAALLGAPDRQRPRQAAEAPAAAGQAGPARDVVRRHADRVRAGDPPLRRGVRRQSPKAVAALTTDQERLPTLFDYPADHWKHRRTTNPIESTFATVRFRERVTTGAGSRTAGLTMAFKLLKPHKLTDGGSTAPT
jgi:putative transposase